MREFVLSYWATKVNVGLAGNSPGTYLQDRNNTSKLANVRNMLVLSDGVRYTRTCHVPVVGCRETLPPKTHS